MNKTKYEILHRALETIALANYKSQPVALAQMASAALREAHAVIEYRITARTWYGSNGGQYKAELIRVDTGQVLIALKNTIWGSDSWAYDMRTAMYGHFPNLFPNHENGNPTIYFREVCKVDYDHQEVAR